jgi:hypothetical protein
MAKAEKILIDGREFLLSDLNENARAQLANIKFVDEQIQQKKNEWAVADTARMAYEAALSRELKAS